MYPFSYTNLKIVHDQRIQEALERQRFSVRHEARKKARPATDEQEGSRSFSLTRVVENKQCSSACPEVVSCPCY